MIFVQKQMMKDYLLIETEYFRNVDKAKDKKYFLYINNARADNIKDMFQFRNSNLEKAVNYVENNLGSR